MRRSRRLILRPALTVEALETRVLLSGTSLLDAPLAFPTPYVANDTPAVVGNSTGTGQPEGSISLPAEEFVQTGTSHGGTTEYSLRRDGVVFRRLPGQANVMFANGVAELIHSNQGPGMTYFLLRNGDLFTDGDSPGPGLWLQAQNVKQLVTSHGGQTEYYLRGDDVARLLAVSRNRRARPLRLGHDHGAALRQQQQLGLHGPVQWFAD
jgi:hypothetical protein